MTNIHIRKLYDCEIVELCDCISFFCEAKNNSAISQSHNSTIHNYFTLKSSTSKTRTALGGIFPPGRGLGP